MSFTHTEEYKFLSTLSVIAIVLNTNGIFISDNLSSWCANDPPKNTIPFSFFLL